MSLSGSKLPVNEFSAFSVLIVAAPLPEFTSRSRLPALALATSIAARPAPPITPVAVVSVILPSVVMSAALSCAVVTLSSVIVPPVLNVILISVSAGVIVSITILPAVLSPMTNVPAVTLSISVTSSISIPAPAVAAPPVKPTSMI